MKLSKGKIITIITIILLLFTTAACSSQYSKDKSNSDIGENIKVGIIFNEAGLGDKSFNDLCYDGLLMAQDELGIEFDYSEPKSADDYENLCRKYAKVEEYDLIIAVGAEQEEAVARISKEFPNQKFILMDSQLELPNVSTIYTNWSEQTFLNEIIYEEIKSVINNTWSPGVHKLGLKEKVIGYTREGSNVEIDNYIIESVESIKQSIIDKEISIPSTYEELEIWIKLNQYKN